MTTCISKQPMVIKGVYNMSLENIIRVLAGALILISVLLTYYVSPCWMILTIFVGLNLLQSAFTKFCPAETIIKNMFFHRNPSRG